MLLLLIGFVVLAVPATAQEQIGAFLFLRQLDAITDVDESAIGTTELEPTAVRTARLVWSCDGPQIHLTVGVDDFVGSDGSVQVQWRFDRGAPSGTRQWEVSRTFVFAPDGDIVEFTDQALPASEVVIRVTGYQGAQHDLRFSLAGLTSSLQRLPCASARDHDGDRAAQALCRSWAHGLLGCIERWGVTKVS